MIYQQYYPFQELKTQYESLEPNISDYTLFFHYNEHYLPALKKLNGMVLAEPILQNIPLEMLSHNDNIEIARLAAAVFGHELYFKSLSPEITEPSEHLKEIIERQFGSVENFLDSIRENAADVYGSGFTWVLTDNNGGLFIMSTPDHTLPKGDNMRPVYALDLWEHSYYLDRQNHRADYVDAALEIINWAELEKNL